MLFHYMPKHVELEYIYTTQLEPEPHSRINFFVDVKNGLLRDNKTCSEHNKLMHCQEFVKSVIELISYIRNYYYSRHNLQKDRIRFFFFCETGKSMYHKEIDSGYKANRDLSDDVIRAEVEELTSQIVFFSIEFLNTIINTVPNCYFFLGKFSEMDYVPYVIGKEYFEEEDIGVILSSDKDFYQIQNQLNGRIMQLEKMTVKTNWHPGRMFISKTNYLYRFFKDLTQEQKDQNLSFLEEYFMVFRAIIGDSGDNVIGIKGLAVKKAFKFLMMLKNVLRPYKDIIADVSGLGFHPRNFQVIESKLPDEMVYDSILFDKEKWNTNSEIKSQFKCQSYLRKLVLSEQKILTNLLLTDFEIMHNRRKIENSNFFRGVMNNKKVKSYHEVYTILTESKLFNTTTGMIPTIIF